MNLRLNRPLAVRIASLALSVCCAIGLGYVAGYYEATGILPTVRPVASALPPEELARGSLSEVQATLTPLSERDYGEGFNCIDFAWEGMRLLRWYGQQAVIVALIFDEGPGHAVLLVPTSDDGWVFVDPTTLGHIKPSVGMKFGGKVITDIKVLQWTWTPIDDYLACPVCNEGGTP